MTELLRVDLTHGRLDREAVDPGIDRAFIGGRGLGAKLLYDENPPGIDPFDPENRLIIMTGPYTGTGGAYSGFFNVTTKSPLTGTILSSHSAGHWGARLRRTGIDGIVLRGRASTPQYLELSEEGVRLHEADLLRGSDVYETTAQLQERHPDANIFTIGPAGERLVRFAAIMNEKHRAAGRGGAGAVMGSKHLKAIVVHGGRSVSAADPEALRLKFHEATELSRDRMKALGEYGTPMVVGFTGTLGTIPTRNFQDGAFADYELISGEALRGEHFSRHVACFRCPTHCGKEFRATNGYAVTTEGPEYETLALFGSNCGNANVDAIIMANDWCNRLGLDTITTANVVAFTLELAEKDVIGAREAEGLTLAWGNHPAIVELTRRIGYREGWARLLGEGTKRVAEILGPSAQRLIAHVKGLEMPAYDPRGAKGVALGYATSTRGACHLRASLHAYELFAKTMDRTTFEGKAAAVKQLQDNHAVVDSVVICKFAARNIYKNDFGLLAELLNAAAARAYTADELALAGERIYNLEVLFNRREGFGRADDTLPEKCFADPIQTGPSAGQYVPRDQFEHALSEYYALRGWDESGMPTSETLERLGLAS